MNILVVLALFGAASLASASDQNSWSYMLRTTSGATCATRYNTLISSQYYANDPVCGNLVMTALSTYVVSQCPSTAAYSQVWKCMNGWNGTAVDSARVNSWVTFLTNCEVLYIAQRVNTAESESGFTWEDNSCFTRFSSMSAFVSYLSGTTTTTGSAGSIAVSALHVLLAVVAAVAVLLLR